MVHTVYYTVYSDSITIKKNFEKNAPLQLKRARVRIEDAGHTILI